MVKACSAYGCSNRANGTVAGVSFHSFPWKDPALLEKWKRANPRQEFEPTKNSRICSRHFHPDDFVESSMDTNVARKKSKEQLLRRLLKQGAVPSIFPNAPSYLSSEKKPQRSTAATSSERLERELSALQSSIDTFQEADSIADCSLHDVRSRLDQEESKPAGFQFSLCDGKLCIYMLEMEPNFHVACYICLAEDLTVTCGFRGLPLKMNRFVDLLTNGKVSTLSQLVNIMSRIKILKEDTAESDDKVSHLLDMAEDLLEEVEELADNRTVSFALEQLKLSRKPASARRYSQELLVFAYLIYSISAAAYKTMLEQEALCLPSDRTLRSITARVGSKVGLDNEGYLKLRASKLEQVEKVVVLAIDEIYIANRVEYNNGQLNGLDADGATAKTLCCFMIRSVASQYKDMIAMHAVATLTAKKLTELFHQAMSVLRKLNFTVCAVCVDNAAVNRKFVRGLCGNNFNPCFMDEVTGQPVFVLFDPVHNLKNIYNNFQIRGEFRFPAFPIRPQVSEAHFGHIVRLYELEATKPLKLAHKLSPAVLNPKSIEKTSVKLAAAVFDESTLNALRYYTEHEGKIWQATADFISLVLKLWHILNVRTPFKGTAKRDISQDPVRSSLDWKLQFLLEFAEFLESWEKSGYPGLSKETFLACRVTCRALAACAAHLLDHEGFSFVLLGALQSDCIESRFGWLRQMSGANFYISARQVKENSRKIAAVSLLKYSEFSLKEIDAAIDKPDDSSSSVQECVNNLAVKLDMDCEPAPADQTVIYYVIAAVARTLVKNRRCDSCRELLLEEDAAAQLDVDWVPAQASSFIDQINRGGLCQPTEFAFALGTHCWKIFEEIRRKETLKKEFMCAQQQQLVFCGLVDEMTDDALFLESFTHLTTCTHGHDVKTGLSKAFFNCMMKNLAKEVSGDSERGRKRKIAKLSSQSADSY